MLIIIISPVSFMLDQIRFAMKKEEVRRQPTKQVEQVLQFHAKKGKKTD